MRAVQSEGGDFGFFSVVLSGLQRKETYFRPVLPHTSVDVACLETNNPRIPALHSTFIVHIFFNQMKERQIFFKQKKKLLKEEYKKRLNDEKGVYSSLNARPTDTAGDITISPLVNPAHHGVVQHEEAILAHRQPGLALLRLRRGHGLHTQSSARSG